jgi:hypothetical protein
MNDHRPASENQHQPNPVNSAPKEREEDTATDTNAAESHFYDWQQWTVNDWIQGGILVAAVFYGFVSAGLWYTTREGIHSGQRAYLIVENVRLAFLPEAGKGLTVHFDVKNTGQTPALNMSSFPVVGVYAGDPPPADRTLERGTIDLGAGQSNLGTAFRLIPVLSPQDVAEVTRDPFFVDGNTITMALRDRRICIYGVIRYTDVFGGADETEFCLVSMPKSMWSADGRTTFAHCTAPNRNRIK